jgi:hypothetical protein
MPANTAEIRYDPSKPPVAILAAVDLLARAGPAAAASSSAATAAVPHVQLLPTAGLSTPSVTLPDSTQVLIGSSLVLRYLAHASVAAGSGSLYGTGASQRAQVDFFLDLSPLLVNKDTLNKYAAVINEHLAVRTTLVAEQGITVADLAVFEALTSQSRNHAHTHKNRGAIPFLPSFPLFHSIFKDASLLVSCLQ